MSTTVLLAPAAELTAVARLLLDASHYWQEGNRKLAKIMIEQARARIERLSAIDPA